MTIVGPFNPGELILVLNWRADGLETLIYIVEPTEPVKPVIPPPPEGMVLIPAGEFEMGSQDAEADIDEQPIHRVHVDAFYMDTHEVTNLDYKRFVLENPQWQKANTPGALHDGDYLDHWSGQRLSDG